MQASDLFWTVQPHVLQLLNDTKPLLLSVGHLSANHPSKLLDDIFRTSQHFVPIQRATKTFIYDNQMHTIM